MKVFVTGGSSPLGELVVPRLSETHDVWALARSDTAAGRIQHRGATPVEGALEDPSSWAAVAHNADVVVHLAGMRFAKAVVANVDPQQPLTVIGSASVRNHAHHLSEELRAAEGRLIAAKPEALVILRPTMIYGASGDKNVRLLARLVARLPAVPRLIGGGLIQPILADDVASAVATTLGTTQRIEADLGGPAAIQLGDLVGELARLLDKRLVPVPVPVPALAWVGDLISRRRSSRGLHALAMLRHDRAVAPAGDDIFGRPPTGLAEGLSFALSRYSTARDR